MASLGLLILAVVSGMIVGSDRGTPVSVGSISYLIGTAIVFLAGSLFVGIRLVPHIFRHAAKTASRGVLFTLSLSLCFLLSYLSATIGLAPIVVRSLFSIIQTINETDGVAVLLVEQNAALALEIAARAYVLEEGRIAAEGRPEELRAQPHIRRAYLG